jgi:hypothetical protein
MVPHAREVQVRKGNYDRKARMKLQLLHGFEGEAALVTPVLTDTAIVC